MSTIVFNDANGHSLTLHRVIYTIDDSFAESSDFSFIQKSIRISISAKMKRNEINSYRMWSFNGNNLDGINRNTVGSLFFNDDSGEYKRIDNIFILGIEEIGDTWREWGDVKVEFSNEGMNGDSIGLITFTDGTRYQTIYNANISVHPSYMRRSQSSIPSFNGSFSQKSGYDYIRINLTGTIPWDSCSFPEEVVSMFEQFDSVGDKNNCHPKAKNFSDFFPNIKGIGYRNIIIESANIVWMVEQRFLQINVSFVGPNQRLKEKEV